MNGSSSSLPKLWIEGFKGALLLEGLTCIGRFGLDMQSTRDTARMAKFTMGLRIHHAYPGLLLIFVGMLRRYKQTDARSTIEMKKNDDNSKNNDKNNIISRMFSKCGYNRPYTIPEWYIVGGVALFISDMIHHFLVLWPITGQHQFDLTY